MAKKKESKDKSKDLDTELKGLIQKNEHLTTGMKKIIDSIENKKLKGN